MKKSLEGHVGLVISARWLSRMVRKLNRFVHKLQFFVEWKLGSPEYFEHQIDLNFLWHETQMSYPMERGVYSSFALSDRVPANGVTLDLCCGDGFYTYYFYSKRSSRVVGIDFDPACIAFARKNYSKAANINFIIGDIRYQIPSGPFDNIIWDAAIAHFTEDEILKIMERIKVVLTPTGILSGYTIMEKLPEGKHIPQVEYEFRSKEDLASFLAPHFKNVQVFSTSHPDRTNFYFYASDSLLPFERENNIVIKNSQ